MLVFTLYALFCLTGEGCTLATVSAPTQAKCEELRHIIKDKPAVQFTICVQEYEI